MPCVTRKEYQETIRAYNEMLTTLDKRLTKLEHSTVPALQDRVKELDGRRAPPQENPTDPFQETRRSANAPGTRTAA